MKIFISWSGDRARRVAKELRDWLPNVIPLAKPWMSDEDLDPGSRWNERLGQVLRDMDFGIICLTPESSTKPWVLFEAGALAKSRDEAIVCPYVIDMDVEELHGPLSQFHSVKADEQGTFRLVQCINKATQEDSQVPGEWLERQFKTYWPQLLDKIRPDRLPLPPGRSLGVNFMGLDSVYESRAPALQKFREYMEEEIRAAEAKRPACIMFVSTSMRGFLFQQVSFDGRDLLAKAVRVGCELRILLVHPIEAELRAPAEKRPKGSISQEIRSNVTDLRELGVRRESVRYYRMGPTVFGIATSDAMLLNPYPSAAESQHYFSMIVHRVQRTPSIYEAYKKEHFQKLWDNFSESVPDKDWLAGKPDRTGKPRDRKGSGRG